MSAVIGELPWPYDWRPGEGAEDLRFAQKLVEETMSPYWQKRRMMFSRQLFREQWVRLETAIIMQAGERAGLIAWDASDGVHHLRELHLTERFRGQGLGSRALFTWIDREEGLGARSMRLKVFEENPARRLYEKAGFQMIQGSGEISGLLIMERLCKGAGFHRPANALRD